MKKINELVMKLPGLTSYNAVIKKISISIYVLVGIIWIIAVLGLLLNFIMPGKRIETENSSILQFAGLDNKNDTVNISNSKFKAAALYSDNDIILNHLPSSINKYTLEEKNFSLPNNIKLRETYLNNEPDINKLESFDKIVLTDNISKNLLEIQEDNALTLKKENLIEKPFDSENNLEIKDNINNLEIKNNISENKLKAEVPILDRPESDKSDIEKKNEILQESKDKNKIQSIKKVQVENKNKIKKTDTKKTVEKKADLKKNATQKTVVKKTEHKKFEPKKIEPKKITKKKDAKTPVTASTEEKEKKSSEQITDIRNQFIEKITNQGPETKLEPLKTKPLNNLLPTTLNNKNKKNNTQNKNENKIKLHKFGELEYRP